MSQPIPARYEQASSALGRALDRTCGGRAIPGNRVEHFADGPQALDAMLALIEEASSWIHFENYIIRDDSTGQRFGDHLRAAARRGVDVRVLYDHFGCRGTHRGYWRWLTAAGASVAAFNPLNPLRPLRSVRRDHRKYVGTDGRRAVVSGLCIGDEWAGRPTKQIPPWRDTAVLVEGPSVPAIDTTFLRKWARATGTLADVTPPQTMGVAGNAGIRVIDGKPGELKLLRAINLLAASAAHRLWITDAYLVAPTPLYAGLMAAARDGVDVRLLLPGRTDIPAVRALTRVGYRELLQAGARIWEWHGPMLHAKTVIVDDRWFKVGSSNLNPSSLLSNHELDVLIDDETLATNAAQQFRRDLAEAMEVVLRARRGPQPLASRLPPAVVPAATPTLRDRRPTTRRELQRRAVMTLGQVAGGARRSIGGALVFTSVGAGVLFVALPRLMAYALAGISFGLAVLAAWEFLRRRAYRTE